MATQRHAGMDKGSRLQLRAIRESSAEPLNLDYHYLGFSDPYFPTPSFEVRGADAANVRIASTGALRLALHVRGEVVVRHYHQTSGF